MKQESCQLLGMNLKVKRKKNIARACDIIKILFFSLTPILEAPTGNTSTGGSGKEKDSGLGSLLYYW